MTDRKFPIDAAWNEADELTKRRLNLKPPKKDHISEGLFRIALCCWGFAFGFGLAWLLFWWQS